MKKLLFIALLLITSIISRAQFDEIIEGVDFTSGKKETFNGFLGQNLLAIFTVDYSYANKKKHELFFRKFHLKDLQLADEKDVFTNPIEDFYQQPLEAFFLENKLFLYSIFENDKEEFSYFGLFIYDDNFEELNFFVLDTFYDSKNTEFQIKIAEDKSGFIVLKNTMKSLYQKSLEIKFLDVNGKQLWNKDLFATQSINPVSVEEIIVKNQNEIFLLCNIGYKSNPEETRALLNNKYSVWIYNNELNYLKEIELKLKLKWINSANIKLNNNQLVISGFTNTAKNFAINGVFSLILNSKYEPGKPFYQEFDEAIFSKFIKKFDEQKTKDLANYYLRNLVVLDDKSFYLIGEEYEKYIERSFDPRTNLSATYEHYNYHSILIAGFDASGKLVWVDRIPKSQNTINDRGMYSSITIANFGKMGCIFYNDFENNHSMGNNDYFDHREIYNNRRSKILFSTFDNNGIAKKEVLPIQQNNYLVFAKQSNQITKNTMFLHLESGKSSKIVKLEVKN